MCHCQCLDLVQMKAILTVLLTRSCGPVTSNKCTQVHAVSQTLRGPKLCTEYTSLSPSKLLPPVSKSHVLSKLFILPSHSTFPLILFSYFLSFRLPTTYIPLLIFDHLNINVIKTQQFKLDERIILNAVNIISTILLSEYII